MIGKVLYMGAVILTAGIPIRDPSTFAHANVIRIKGVCMQITNDAQYEVYFSADFWRIDITRQDTIGHVYIRWNPDIEGNNVAWERNSKPLNLPAIVPLGGEQAGEFLGIPKREDDPYFHLWFDKGSSKDGEKILKLLGFC